MTYVIAYFLTQKPSVDYFQFVLAGGRTKNKGINDKNLSVFIDAGTICKFLKPRMFLCYIGLSFAVHGLEQNTFLDFLFVPLSTASKTVRVGITARSIELKASNS
jgi:hypothetical protein